MDAVEEEEVPLVDEILPRPGRDATDFNFSGGADPEPIVSIVREREIFTTKCAPLIFRLICTSCFLCCSSMQNLPVVRSLWAICLAFFLLNWFAVWWFISVLRGRGVWGWRWTTEPTVVSMRIIFTCGPSILWRTRRDSRKFSSLINEMFDHFLRMLNRPVFFAAERFPCRLSKGFVNGWRPFFPIQWEFTHGQLFTRGLDAGL